MKQTAVEWLIQQIEKDSDIIFYERNLHPYEEYIEQAKQMEKEQIMDAYLKNHLQGCWMKNTPEEYAEQYYNETFKSE